MSGKNLTIDLRPRTDSQKNIFYVGKLEAPVLIDCSRGVTFLIFVSEDGSQQLQITSMDKKETRDQD
jgi:hypothetical protein